MPSLNIVKFCCHLYYPNSSLDDPHGLRGAAGADVQLLRQQPAVRVRAGREDGRPVHLHRGQPPGRELHVLRQPADLRHRLLHGPALPRQVDRYLNIRLRIFTLKPGLSQKHNYVIIHTLHYIYVLSTLTAWRTSAT